MDTRQRVVFRATARVLRILGIAACMAGAEAGTSVHLGTVRQVAAVSDLDLEGNVVLALNFRATEVVTLGGVDFLPDEAAPMGATLTGPHFSEPWETKPEFGDTPDDDALERLLLTIRRAFPDEMLRAQLDVRTGHRYKVQILISENQDRSRSWDIAVNGRLAVEEITSLGTDADTYSVDRAVVYAFEVEPETSTLDIVMGQLNGVREGADAGALWQALTLEDLGPGADSDSDGMPDAFEAAYGLDGERDDSGADSDGDGVTHLDEFLKGTDPTESDTDGDGLGDGVETNTGIWAGDDDRGTDPLRADTDGDTLPDGVESRTAIFVSSGDTGSDPLLADSDTDGFGDGLEVLLGSAPADAASTPENPGQVKLLAHWGFDDAVVESGTGATLVPDSVQGRAARLESGAALSEPGGGRSGAPSDHSVRFGLAGGPFVLIDDATFLNLPARADAATVSIWQKSTAILNSTTFWGATADAQLRGASAHLPWGDGALYFDTGGCCDPATQRTSVLPADDNGNSLIPVERWHHFALVKNGPLKQIWLNGTLLHEAVNRAPWPSDFFRLFLGAGPGGTRSIVGEIDDFAVFHGALLPAQIKALASGMAPAATESIQDIDDDSLPDAWELANGLDTSVNDAGEDPDGDQVTNCDEFLHATNPQLPDTDDDTFLDGEEIAAGSNPNDPASRPASPAPMITGASLAPDSSRITLDWTSRNNARYTVETSADLVDWIAGRTGIPSEGATTTVTITVTDPASGEAFFRIREE